MATQTTTPATALALQSRISHLSLSLLRHFNALLSASQNPTNPNSTSADPDADQADQKDTKPPSAIQTISTQIDIEVETAAIVKAVEEKDGDVDVVEGGGLEGEEPRQVRVGMEAWVDGWVRTEMAKEREGTDGADRADGEAEAQGTAVEHDDAAFDQAERAGWTMSLL
ncbi:uncharacterized protein AB675_7187 [Cyphellophora attinorum]|uniref:Uncharacterized protein n=1 Tax=Cyphellophora attinorum TaxID=1664694 RepID=A0A0N0NHX0_9EURO|nr:uncharacterized protein AB675_7187 [Phialophora attinorum]KPI35058.1 hypothetical protein AB675_7187 [Phialophora attinorum]